MRWKSRLSTTWSTNRREAMRPKAPTIITNIAISLSGDAERRGGPGKKNKARRRRGRRPREGRPREEGVGRLLRPPAVRPFPERRVDALLAERGVTAPPRRVPMRPHP